jgi:hypothetical protein
MKTEIRSLLRLDQWPDLVVGNGGFAAKRRVDIAPFAYEIVIGKPPREDTLRKLLDYATGADQNLVRDLFSLCNGIRIGATKFGVYGVLGQVDRSTSDATSCSPLDINVPNIYGRPEGWPESYLIVGFSREVERSGQRRRMLHAVTPHGKVTVSSEDDYLEVHREYPSIELWLLSEVQRALDNVEAF